MKIEEITKIVYDLIKTEECSFECYYNAGGDNGWFDELKFIGESNWTIIKKEYKITDQDIFKMCNSYEYVGGVGYYSESGFYKLFIEDDVLYLTVEGTIEYEEGFSKEYNLLEHMEEHNITFDLEVLQECTTHILKYCFYFDYIDIEWFTKSLPQLVKERYSVSLGVLSADLYETLEDWINNVYKSEWEVAEDSLGFTIEFDTVYLKDVILSVNWREYVEEPRESRQTIEIN